MNLKERLLKNTGIYLKEEEELNEGIRFFKTSKKLKKAYGKLKAEMVNNPPRTNEEENYVNSVFEKLEKIINKLTSLESKFEESKSPSEKAELKKEYQKIEEELKDFFSLLINKKIGSSAYISNFFSILGKSMLITLLVGAVGLGAGALLGGVLGGAAAANVGGDPIGFMGAGASTVGGFGAIIGLLLGGGIAKDQNAVMKQKQALEMAEKEKGLNSDLVRKAKVLLAKVGEKE